MISAIERRPAPRTAGPREPLARTRASDTLPDSITRLLTPRRDAPIVSAFQSSV